MKNLNNIQFVSISNSIGLIPSSNTIDTVTTTITTGTDNCDNF